MRSAWVYLGEGRVAGNFPLGGGRPLVAIGGQSGRWVARGMGGVARKLLWLWRVSCEAACKRGRVNWSCAKYHCQRQKEWDDEQD